MRQTPIKSITKVGLLIFAIGILVFWGHGHLTKERHGNTREVTGMVLTVDNSDVIRVGAGMVGVQRTVVMLDSSLWKGQKVEANNLLNGQLEIDELYRPGDKILLAIQVAQGAISDAKTINTYRQNWELVLFLLFAFGLLLYAGVIGFKALISFVGTLALLWGGYIPALLSGVSPLPLSLAILVLLSMVIIFTVAGFSRQAVAAFLGTVCGMAVTLTLTLYFGHHLKLYGMTAPFSTILLVQGAYGLNFQHIFYSAVLLGASGAAMDIAMDVSASMNEVKKKRPDIGMIELIQSGVTVGRMVIGTMATTLLLAYSGGYLTMLMLFVSQNTSIARILNMKLVAAEIFRILIGSIGLLMVAPITAGIAGLLLHGAWRLRRPQGDPSSSLQLTDE